MIISWNWLREYVPIQVTPAEVEQRLMMAGLNHESTSPVGEDLAIDLEITSNRSDCLGHLGIAREVSVLFDLPLNKPAAELHEGKTPTPDLTSVEIQCPDLCRRYSARVIRGAKIGPSPTWLAQRLTTIGMALVNNVVDVTNYVMMESGQPLHAFDFARLRGRRIIVREPHKGEQLQAIDHHMYALEPRMCVIADERYPVALAGVMGGAETEVTQRTTELLIEAADFNPVSIRSTARKLGLHSPSSYRFERGVDPAGVDWASRRCCELILDVAGGDLAVGSVDVGQAAPHRQPVVLRFSQLKRILGIEVPEHDVRRILKALGLQESGSSSDAIITVPPSWRGDLSREIDLVEEVARIHGYDKIPEDVTVPMAPSHRSHLDRVLDDVRRVLTSCSFDEALTTSVVRAELSTAYSPWTDEEPIVCGTPLLKGADQMRRSLVPSLLEARRINESLTNPACELFEIARVYLPSAGKLPDEQWTLGMISGRAFGVLKGVIEALLQALRIQAQLEVQAGGATMLDPHRSCMLKLNGATLGFLGELSVSGLKKFSLREATCVCELNLVLLAEKSKPVVKFLSQSAFPSITRDLNLIVDETTCWSDMSTVIAQATGEYLEKLGYQETYRDTAKDGTNKKRVLFTVTLRSFERTLTNEEADKTRDAVVRACGKTFGARLLV